MPPNPSLISFILHRKSFWLSMFTIVFLAWARHDSKSVSTTFNYHTPNFFFSAKSHIGGFSLSINDPNPFITPGFSLWRDFGDASVVWPEPKLIFLIDPPDIHYSTLMLLVIAATTAWLTWRWRKTVAEVSRLPAFFL